MCGIESSDYNESLVGGMIAEFLAIPSVSSVSSLNIEGDKPMIIREIDGGKETLSVPGSFCGYSSEGHCQRTQNSLDERHNDCQNKTDQGLRTAANRAFTAVIAYEKPA